MFSEIGNECVCANPPYPYALIEVTFLIDKLIGRIGIAVAACIKTL